MRYIRKQAQPRCLVTHRRQKHASYANLKDDCKSKLRAALLRDQGFLCCYCMQRIRDDEQVTKVEHWMSQKVHPEQQLLWKNLLAACKGNEGHSEDEQHCDTRKGNRPLSVDPTDPRTERLIRYEANGRIVCDDPGKQRGIDQVLNLNLPFLCRNRNAALDAFFEAERRRNHGTWSNDALEQRLRELQTPADGQLPAFVGVIIAWIRKRQGHHR